MAKAKKEKPVVTPKKHRPSTRGLAKAKSPVGKQALGILRRVVNGEVLRGERENPFPLKYSITTPGKPPATVAASLVASLVEARLIDAEAREIGQTYVLYHVTDAGRDLAKHGPVSGRRLSTRLDKIRMTARRPSYDEAEHEIRRPKGGSPDFGLFAEPEIRTPAPSAPGSETSEAAAEAVTDPMRARSHRLVMLALGAAARPLSREELSERTGMKESSLCARLAELRPMFVKSVSGACIAVSGLSVDGYRLTSTGRNRLKGAA